MNETALTKKIRDRLKLEGIDCIKYFGSAFSERGVSDLICVIPKNKGQALFIECKVPKNKPTPSQLVFLERMNALGAKTAVIHSMEELEKLIHSLDA